MIIIIIIIIIIIKNNNNNITLSLLHYRQKTTFRFVGGEIWTTPKTMASLHILVSPFICPNKVLRKSITSSERHFIKTHFQNT